MKNYYLILSFVLTIVVFDVSSQQYVNKIWQETVSGIGQNRNVVTEVDPNGNLVCISNTQSNSNSDILLSCTHPNGAIAWQQTCPSSTLEDDYGVDLKIDGAGNIYLCAAQHNGSNYDYFIAKYSQSGNLEWQQNFNGSGNGEDVPAAIELDANSDVYVTGLSTGLGTLVDMVTLKLDGNNGSLIWNSIYDYNNKVEFATDLEIDENGNVFICGVSTQNFGNSHFTTIKLDGATGIELFSDRHNTQGSGLDKPKHLCIAPNGNVYLVGTIRTNQADKDIKVLAYTNDLQPLWENLYDNSGGVDEGESIVIDANNNVYVTGYTTKPNGGTNLFLARYNPLTGNEEWLLEKAAFVDVEISKGNQLILNDQGNIILCGEDELDGTHNMFTASFDTDGILQWSERFNADASGMDVGLELSIDDNFVYSTSRSTVNGIDETTTIKYSTTERNIVAVEENNEAVYVDDNVLVRFDKSFLHLSKIDDKEFVFGVLSDFVKDTLLTQMAVKTGFDWTKLRTYKIHTRATSADTVSMSRLGTSVNLPDFWATLSIDLPITQDENQLCDTIKQIFGIHEASTNTIYQLHGDPSDPLYVFHQYALKPNLVYPNSDINARDAWDIEVGNESVKVGVFDETIDWSHIDFGQNGTQQDSKVVGGWDYHAGTDLSFSDFTLDSHGTRVAGIIGAIRNQGTGIAGVAGGDLIDNFNRGVQLESMTIANGANFIIAEDIKAAVVEGSVLTPTGFGYGQQIQNHSYGGAINNPFLSEAIDICWKNHCVFVASRGNAGNSGNPAEYPGCNNDLKVLNVIASGTDGERKTTLNGFGNWASSFGLSGANNTASCNVDFMAPGTNELIGTTTNQFDQSTTQGGCNLTDPLYRCFSGTSAAAPLVSGVAALMCSKHNILNGYDNNLATEDIENILQKTAVDKWLPGYDLGTGHGLIDAFEALKQVDDPYFVKHFQYNGVAANATITLDYDYPTGAIIFGAEDLGIANGSLYPIAKRYKIEWTINEILPSNQTIIDWWEFEAARVKGNDGFGSGQIITVNEWMTDNLNVVINGNTVTGTATTYVHYIETNGGSTGWLPFSADKATFAYSLHIEKDAPLGIDENAEDVFSIYPNPTNSIVNIAYATNEKVTIELIDAAGRVIIMEEFSSSLDGDISIDVSDLENGIYYCKLLSGDKSFTKPFVKGN